MSGRRARGICVAMVAACAMLGALGCGGSSSGAHAESSPADDIARTHRARCGACHTRVEPGERTREQLDSALARHRKRVRLTESEWGRMVDYLAGSDAGAP